MNKRKYTAKIRSVHYSEDAESDQEDLDNGSGDGSSSGDSVPPDVAARTKRQRTSRIVTRSSNRTSTADPGMEGGLNEAAPAPLVTVQPSLVTPNTDTVGPPGSTSAMSIDSSDLQPVGGSAGTAAVDDSPSASIPCASRETPTGPDDIAEIEITSDTDVPPKADTEFPPATDAEFTPATDAEVRAVTAAQVPPDTATKLVVEAASSARSSVITPMIPSHSPPPPGLPDGIDVGGVPSFLRSHGTGKRKVDIFDYLDKVQDPRFQRVFLLYLRVEIHDKSGVGGSLPTINRPVEIAQWSSRARPAILPDFTKGKRTFSDFTNSTFAWWTSIQPSWRSFERGKVSREDRGGWDVLYAPRINGFLNVVMLVYWWVRILEEQDPKDSVRAHYEQFADDVAWVLSRLC